MEYETPAIIASYSEEELTTDAAVAMTYHVIIGTFRNGVRQTRINLKRIVVRDMRRSLAFYRLLGVSIEEVRAPEWAEWAGRTARPRHGARAGWVG